MCHQASPSDTHAALGTAPCTWQGHEHQVPLTEPLELREARGGERGGGIPRKTQGKAHSCAALWLDNW